MKKTLLTMACLLLVATGMAQENAPFLLKEGDAFSISKQLWDRKEQLVANENDLPPITLKYGIAKVRGHVLGYKQGGNQQFTWKLTRYTHTPERESEKDHPIILQANGDFEVLVPVVRPTILYMRSNDHIIGKFYITPDQTTEVYFRPVHIDRATRQWQNKGEYMMYVTDGPLAGLSNDMEKIGAQSWMGNVLGNKINMDISRLTPKEAVQVMTDSINRLWAKEDSLIGTDGKRIATGRTQLSPAAQKLEEMERDRVVFECLIQSYSNNNEQWDSNKFQLFIDAIQEVIGDSRLMYSNNFESLLLIGRGYLSNLTFTASTEYIRNELRFMGIQAQLENLIPADDELLNSLPQPYRQLLQPDIDRMNRVIAEIQKLTGYTVREDLPDVEDSLLFNALCKRYEGKVIILNLWEPTQPLVTMDEVVRMQEKYAGNNIAWVNLCYTEPDDIVWHLKLPKYKGDHYAISSTQEYGILNKKNDVETIGEDGIIYTSPRISDSGSKLMIVDTDGHEWRKESANINEWWNSYYENHKVNETIYKAIKASAYSQLLKRMSK